MPFQKGHQKWGGRKVGSPHKLAPTVAERLEQLGCDPIEGLYRIATAEDTRADVKAKCYAELAQYVYPKRKAIEHSGPGGGPIETQDVTAVELLRSRIAGIAERAATGGNLPKPE